MFLKGFDKVAVSESWIRKRVASGILKRDPPTRLDRMFNKGRHEANADHLGSCVAKYVSLGKAKEMAGNRGAQKGAHALALREIGMLSRVFPKGKK